jgi:uncharacterized SAM-binding protein YcdF (DUF218 family)
MKADTIADALRLLGDIVDPAPLLSIFVLAGLLATLIAYRRLALVLQGGAAAIIVLIGVLPGGSWLAWPLETRFPGNPPLPREIAGIIAIGGTERVSQSQIWSQPTLDDPTPIAALVVLGRKYPEAEMVFTGGGARPAGSPATEATVVRDFLGEFGVDAERIRYEDRSQNTRENAVFSRQLIRPRPGERWILVAQAVALPRAVAAFRGAGWDVVPFPAGYLTNGDRDLSLSLHLRSGLDLASVAVHEWGGLVAYRLLGYTEEIFPR